MKGFFKKLFGGSEPPETPGKRDQAAAQNTPKPQPSPAPATSKRSDLKPGEFIAGEYRVRRVFGGEGKSGMGVVYLVEGRTSEEPFVLKTFQSERSDNASIARFKAEAETWINIGKHANIVQCHWVRGFSDQLFVAAEYICPDAAGRNTLAHHLASGSLSLLQQLHWIAQFCFGMKHAMAHGLLAHRDIKPDNLMIDNRGRLKITDFGLAKGLSPAEQTASLQVTEGGNETLTVAGSAFGTVPYMAPEQFMDSSAVDHRADIYSLGIVIYMMISGGRWPIVPVAGSGWALAHYRQRVARLDHPLMSCAEKCLEKDRRSRFQTYGEILATVSETCRKHAISIPTDEQDASAEFSRQWGIAMSLVNLNRPEESIPKLREMEARWPEASEVYTELGRAYRLVLKFPEALQATEKSLQLFPYSTAAWNNLGGILAHLKRIADAKNAYRNSLRIEPENTGAMVSLAHLLLEEGELKEAKQLCETALFWRPEKPNVWMVASLCLMQCGEAKRALELLEKLVLLPADSKDWSSDFKQQTSWYNLAICRQSLGDTAGCMQALEEVLKRNPKDADAWKTKGNILDTIGRREDAIRAYDRALQIAPQDATIWRNKGNTLGNLKRYQDALGCFEEAQKLGDPTAAKSIEQCRSMLRTNEDYFERGCALYHAGKFEEAIRCFDAALAADAKNPDVWNSKALALKAVGKSEQAIQCHKKALAADRHNTNAWNGMGNRFMDLHKFEDALASYNEALAINPADINALYAKGSALKALGKLDEAVVCYEKALTIDPKTADIWRSLADVSLVQGHHEKALRCFNKVLEINPKDVKTLFDKANILGPSGRFQEALVCYQEAEKLGDPNAAAGIEQCRKFLASEAIRLFKRGAALRAAGNHTEAIQCYEAGIAFDATNPLGWFDKGVALLALQRPSEAVACFDRVIALSPRSASAWNNKGIALMSMGQRLEGMTCIMEAKNLEKR